MNKTTEEKIDLCIERGLSDYVIRELLSFAYEGELIRFDNIGNPYWNGNGESLDPDVELKFEE